MLAKYWILFKRKKTKFHSSRRVELNLRRERDHVMLWSVWSRSGG
ncbi:MAG: hypothetical protein WC862_01280 [Patescibacteria group bacterium]